MSYVLESLRHQLSVELPDFKISIKLYREVRWLCGCFSGGPQALVMQLSMHRRYAGDVVLNQGLGFVWAIGRDYGKYKPKKTTELTLNQLVVISVVIFTVHRQTPVKSACMAETETFKVDVVTAVVTIPQHTSNPMIYRYAALTTCLIYAEELVTLVVNWKLARTWVNGSCISLWRHVS